MGVMSKKLWANVVLRSFAAMALGAVTVTAFVSLLSLYGAAPDSKASLAAQSLKFPENEQMLDKVSAQNHKGEILTTIEHTNGPERRMHYMVQLS